MKKFLIVLADILSISLFLLIVIVALSGVYPEIGSLRYITLGGVTLAIAGYCLKLTGKIFAK